MRFYISLRSMGLCFNNIREPNSQSLSCSGSATLGLPPSSISCWKHPDFIQQET